MSDVSLCCVRSVSDDGRIATGILSGIEDARGDSSSHGLVDPGDGKKGSRCHKRITLANGSLSAKEEQIGTHQTEFSRTMRHPRADKHVQSAGDEFNPAPRGERQYCVNNSPSCPVSVEMSFNVGQGTHRSLSHTCNMDIWYIQLICNY